MIKHLYIYYLHRPSVHVNAAYAQGPCCCVLPRAICSRTGGQSEAKDKLPYTHDLVTHRRGRSGIPGGNAAVRGLNQLPVLLAWDGKTWAKFGHLFCCHLFNPLLTSRLMHVRACQYSVDTAGLPSDPFSCTHFLSCSYVRIVIITTLKCTSLNWLLLLTITTENL
jgi:hypothetical protein